MSLQVEKLEKSMAKLTIEATAEEFDQAMEKAFQRSKNKISIPGFRKGKVTRQMAERMYGPQLFYEDAVNLLIPDAYEKALDECDLEIVSQPKIDVTQMEKGKPFIFTAEVAIKPEVTLILVSHHLTPERKAQFTRVYDLEPSTAHQLIA